MSVFFQPPVCPAGFKKEPCGSFEVAASPETRAADAGGFRLMNDLTLGQGGSSRSDMLASQETRRRPRCCGRFGEQQPLKGGRRGEGSLRPRFRSRPSWN
eukprot:s3439_g8.t5